MKKVLSILIFFIIVSGSSVIYAAEKAPLGSGDVAIKVDYIDFTDHDMKILDTNSGVFVGIEAYSEVPDVLEHLYVGLETGIASIDGDVRLNTGLGFLPVDTQATFVPIELNLKYAIKITPEMAIDIGGGPSINYGKLEVGSFSKDDWMIGGQTFVDLSYKLGRFFAGINGKYQIMQNFYVDSTDTDVSFRNLRVGGHIGIMF